MIHDGRLQFANQESLSSGWTPLTGILAFIGTAVQVKQLGNLIPVNPVDLMPRDTHVVIQFDTLPTFAGATVNIGAAVISSTTQGATDLLLGSHVTHWSSFDLTTLGLQVKPATVLVPAGKPTWIVPLPTRPQVLDYLGIVLFATEAATGGTVSAFTTNDPNTWFAYRDASN